MAMRYYRRHTHQRKADSLTVDKVLCKIKPRGHETVDGKYLCFHDMTISIPPDPGFPVMLIVPEK